MSADPLEQAISEVAEAVDHASGLGHDDTVCWSTTCGCGLTVTRKQFATINDLLRAAAEDRARLVKALEALLAKVADAPCSCSLLEIESGHRLECHAVEMDALVDMARAALSPAKEK